MARPDREPLIEALEETDGPHQRNHELDLRKQEEEDVDEMNEHFHDRIVEEAA